MLQHQSMCWSSEHLQSKKKKSHARKNNVRKREEMRRKRVMEQVKRSPHGSTSVLVSKLKFCLVGFSVQPVSLACRHGDLPVYFKA